MTKRPLILRGPRLVGLAAIAGILAGLIAIYAGGGLPGNGEVAGARDCSSALRVATRVAPFARGEVAAFQAAVGQDDLSALRFKAPDGSDTSLAAFSGKTVLLNIWATWCVPCREEMPALARLAADLAGDRFAVVAVNIDLNDPDRARAFLTEVGATRLDFFHDRTTEVFTEMKRHGLAFGLPTTVLVDPHGCRIGGIAGPAQWDSPEAKALIGAATESS